MATQEKLVKSLEILKKISLSTDGPSQRKEKIQHCHIVTESICNPTIAVAQNYYDMLSFTIEVLLKLCNDNEVDIRMVAEENINKIIRSAPEGLGKIQIEMCKEIKRNSSARSLRVALAHFSQLAHYIHPQKGKVFVSNLFPCIIKITERSEEQVHETLSKSIPNILKVLGPFTADSDIKSLIRAFLNILGSESAAIRRSAAICVTNICFYSKRSYFFINYSLQCLIDMIFPIEDYKSNHLILGVIFTMKNLLNYLNNGDLEQHDLLWKDNDFILEIDKLLQIYEICLTYLTNKDHNVINGALETLNVLVQNSPRDFINVLLSPEGIGKRTACRKSSSLVKLKSPSQLSVATTAAFTDENLFLESESNENFSKDIEKWIDDSKLSVLDSQYPHSKELEKCQSLDSSNTIINISMSDLEASGNSEYDEINISEITESYKLDKSRSLEDNLERLSVSDDLSEKSLSCMTEDKNTPDENDFEAVDVDIGEFTDREASLVYCTRLLVRSFLLSGKSGVCLPDKLSRVSVKSLALTCLASVFRYCPKAFLIYLDKRTNISASTCQQVISDILLFANHSDPQIRGAIRIAVAEFVRSVLMESSGNYEKWLSDNLPIGNTNMLHMERVISLLLQGLEDESSNCVKQTLNGLNICLKQILESCNFLQAVPIMTSLPYIAKNPYWLVKVTICEVVRNLPYITINYMTGTNDFQNKVLYNILFELLCDEDQRVRSAAANSLSCILPNLYCDSYKPEENNLVMKAIMYKDLYLSNLYDQQHENNFVQKYFIENMPFPFVDLGKIPDAKTEFFLPKIISELYNILLVPPSKHHLIGCVEALYLLSKAYSPIVYSKAWNCPREDKARSRETVPCSFKTSDLLMLCVNLMTNSTSGQDLNLFGFLLQLTSNLYAGYSVSVLRPVANLENTKVMWDMFSDSRHAEMSEKFLQHVVRLLCIFSYILEERSPVPLHSKTVLSNLPTASNLSPIKRRKSDLEKKFISPVKTAEEGDKRENPKNNLIGTFWNSPFYLTLYELLKASYKNYKTSLSSEASGKFLLFLKSTLEALLVLLEIGTLAEFGMVAEEILNYLQLTFKVNPITTVRCVQQLLKALFGTNLTANVSDIVEHAPELENDDEISGFYYNISQKPYCELSVCINSLNNISKIDYDSDNMLMGYLHRKNIKKPALFSRSSDKVLASYIRIFEPMVIKSLRKYKMTSDVHLQCCVLQLLNQLVQLRINYCLLDSEQVFINFVLKQFDFIEEGQILHVEKLIPKIFQFLVQLSYSKQHSKSIISIPKILQLCDGLMASGQSPLSHCIPALAPIVEDVFLTRNKSNTDIKELEATREVVLSMLLRLLEHHQVMDLVVVVLEDSKFCTVNPEKWLKWSQQVIVVLMPLLKQNKFRLDDSDALASLRKMVFALNPTVFKPIDEVVKSLFDSPPEKEDDVIIYKRWLGKISILMLILSPVKENKLLMKINDLKSDFSPSSIYGNVISIADPLNVSNSLQVFQDLTPEMLYIRWLFRTVSLAVDKCVKSMKCQEPDNFYIEELSVFLMYCLHNFQSGCFCQIASVAFKLMEDSSACKDIKSDIECINRNFMELAAFVPTLSYQWCYFLTLLHYNDRKFWSAVLQIEEPGISDNASSINMHVLKVGGVIVYCDFLSESLPSSQDIYWLIENKPNLLIHLIKEAPIHEFISGIHREQQTSNFLLETAARRSLTIENPIFKAKLLQMIENAHSSQTGALIKLLIKLLNSRHFSLSRMASNLACRKIELLLTMSIEEVTVQLTQEDLERIMLYLISEDLTKKHETLLSLLNRLAVQFYDLIPFEINQTRKLNLDYIRSLQIDKTWYLPQIKALLKYDKIGREAAPILEELDLDELTSFVTESDEFNRLLIKDCLIYGVNMYRNGNSREETVILKVGIACVLKDLKVVIQMLPDFEAVSNEDSRDITHSTSDQKRFHNKMFKEESLNFYNKLINLIPSTLCLMESSPILPQSTIPASNYDTIAKFAVICLELVHYLIDTDKDKLNISLVNSALRCVNVILKKNDILNILVLDANIFQLCTAVDSLYNFVTFLLLNDEPLPTVPNYIVEKCSNDTAAKACHQMYTLVCWLCKIRDSKVNIPNFMLKQITSIIFSLARLSTFNSYILIPSKVWKIGWSPELTGPLNTQVPLLPIEYLQEVDILQDFIFRITLTGWTTRQQFEETWMCLLSVLCNVPSDDTDPAEVHDIAHASSLAVRAITNLLWQTLYYPVPGNSSVSTLLHVSRDCSIPCEKVSLKKLQSIQKCLRNKYNECSFAHAKDKLTCVFERPNFEKQNTDAYSYGQLSVKYFLISLRLMEDIDEKCQASDVWRKREKMLEEGGLDINSCLQFLIDFYTQLLQTQSSSLILLHEVVRSILVISDLFNDKGQFSWMLELFLDLSRVHCVEDELIHQYIIVGICKATAVLNPELEIYENVKKILVQYMKSAFLPSRVSCLYGLLYILEGCVLNNISIGGISEELQLMLPCVVEYIQCHLSTNNSVLKKSQEHTLLVWSLAFYIIENIDENHMETNFVSHALELAFKEVTKEKQNNAVHDSVLKGLERIIIRKKNIFIMFGEQALKLALEKMKCDNPKISILGIQLLLSYMYIDCTDHLDKQQEDQTNPEHLVQTIEKISAIFDYIKKGYTSEVQALCSILPIILNDFFTPADILTKVIAEFLSPLQPHPKFLSNVVFHLFESAIEKNQLRLLQDWIVYNLSNVTQNFSVGMATWCLICFFISTSTNKWLRSLFPYMQTRVGRYEYIDRKMLCISGVDFYKNLSSDTQKEMFITNLNKIKCQTDMPFNDLLSCL